MSRSGLSEFQIELANLFFSLPESAGFLLAGGGAPIAQGIVPRPTEDLDFFTARQVGNVEAASDALITAVMAHGWTTDLLRSGPDFRRWAINGPETVLVDLAVDSPSTGPPTLTIAGPALLANPYIGDDLIPHVRDLPYTAASSGGMVLISLAWNLTLSEVAHEEGADAPGLLVIDSPQKNLGHKAAEEGDQDFADAALVENFYAHAKQWLATDGAGAQLIVVDNTPPASVADDVVCRFTRLPDDPPYGLIPEATS